MPLVELVNHAEDAVFKSLTLKSPSTTFISISANALMQIDLVIPGKILLDKAGVHILLSFMKNRLEALLLSKSHFCA